MRKERAFYIIIISIALWYGYAQHNSCNLYAESCQRYNEHLKEFDDYDRYTLIDETTRFDRKTGDIQKWRPWDKDRPDKIEWINGKGYTHGYWGTK